MNVEEFGDNRPEKPEVAYPCQWEYKLIGQDEELMRHAAAEVLADKEHAITPSHQSRTGKYCSILIKVTVVDEDARLSIYDALKGHRDIIMIL